MKKNLAILIFALLSTPVAGYCLDLQHVPDVDVLWVVDNITNFIFVALLAVAVIVFIIAGYRAVTSLGEPAKFESAKKMILYAVIGLIVAFASKGIVMLVESFFPGGGSSSSQGSPSNDYYPTNMNPKPVNTPNPASANPDPGNEMYGQSPTQTPTPTPNCNDNYFHDQYGNVVNGYDSKGNHLPGPFYDKCGNQTYPTVYPAE